MKRLLLLRHAKAEQDSNDDHARKLTKRGRKNAASMGAWLHKHYAIDLVLCSTSARTRETWDVVAEELGAAPKVEFLKALYLAPERTMMTIVQNTEDAADTLMLVAHSPGTEELAAAMARIPANNDEQKRLDTLSEKYPTAALAVLEFGATNWREIKPTSGLLAAFMRPKDLD